MGGTAAQQSRKRLPILLAHIAQFVLAIVILGLASYGVDYISYNVLIYSIAVVSNMSSQSRPDTDLRTERMHSGRVVLAACLTHIPVQIRQRLDRIGSSRLDARLLDCRPWTHRGPDKGVEPAMLLHPRSRQDLLDICHQARHHIQDLLRSAHCKLRAHWTSSVRI